MNYLSKTSVLALIAFSFITASCSKEDDNHQSSTTSPTITIQNVLDSKPLVESGTFVNTSSSGPVTVPGQSTSFSFYAAKGEAISFVCMYGWSNDLFFAPANPGIKVFDDAGKPIEGDVSSQIKLWDNGTRVNVKPGATLQHPGTAETATKNVMEIKGTDANGNSYLAASSLMKATLKYNGNSNFTLTIQNTSGGTANETPFSPGVWAVSYIVGGNLLNENPLYKDGTPTANGLTDIAEMGDTAALSDYIKTQTGTFTPLSPVLVVVYNGSQNPIYTLGQKDAGKGLSDIAQKGDASTLAASLKTMSGVKNVYVLAAENSTVLLPMINGQMGSSVSQQLSVSKGDRIAIATMYGFSNDWFFASKDNGVDATQTGDISSSIGLYDDGTAISEYPGAGSTQFNLAGTPSNESIPIAEVPNPNEFNSLPAVDQFIKVTLQ